MTDGDWKQVQREIMCRDIPERTTPLADAGRDFIYLSLWSRPGLDRRDRRWVTMACCAAADVPGASGAHVYAALESGDMTIDEMLEFSLHFAVYCGWPRATNLEAVIVEQWRRIHEELGEPAPPFTRPPNETTGPNDSEQRIARGIAKFNEVCLEPAPSLDTPYRRAGLLDFVFGRVWQRPGLSRRDRRLITIPCVGASDAPMPIVSQVTSALHSGDLTKEEMDELILQFAAYYGFAKAEVLENAAEAAWASRPR